MARGGAVCAARRAARGVACARAAVWAEGISSAMGAKSKNSSYLNRRGGPHQTGDVWKPLIWAAKENQLMVAETLIGHGYNVNEQESAVDKSNSGYAPIHWAAHKGHEPMVRMLIGKGALVSIKDKHGNTCGEPRHQHVGPPAAAREPFLSGASLFDN